MVLILNILIRTYETRMKNKIHANMKLDLITTIHTIKINNICTFNNDYLQMDMFFSNTFDC